MDTGILSELQSAKAVEYLLAVGFLVLFIPFWRYAAPLHRAAAAVRAAVPAKAQPLGWFTVPDGVAVHPGHAWARSGRDGEVSVGIDDFARAFAGPLVDVDLPAVGSVVRQGEPAWTLRTAAGPLPMISPVDGMVVETNPRAARGAVEADPYGDGWLMKVQAPHYAKDSRQLLSGTTARAFVEDVANRLRDVVAPGLGPAMADGGTPVHGIAAEIAPEVFDRVARDFFLVERGR